MKPIKYQMRFNLTEVLQGLLTEYRELMIGARVKSGGSVTAVNRVCFDGDKYSIDVLVTRDDGEVVSAIMDAPRITVGVLTGITEQEK